MGPADTIDTLVRVFLQTAGLALILAGTGHFLHRRLAAAPTPEGLCLAVSRGYFLGICAFLPAYVVLSRLAGAPAALWITLPLMAGLALHELAAHRHEPRWLRSGAGPMAAILLLTAFYSVSTFVLWFGRFPPFAEPNAWTAMGSIHSGRYANYSIHIAELGRVPYIAQNGGQSMLASVNLLLGIDRPLAALMAWLPISLAFLTLLVFGVFRAGGFAALPCAAATFLVMFGNIALSTIHVLVFDNGSPPGFIGYTDLAIGVATFILACLWMQRRLAGEGPFGRKELAIPALLGVTWCWSAPQNIVVAAAAFAVAALIWGRTRPSAARARHLGAAAIVFTTAVIVGATQFGALMPKSMREDIGLWVQDLGGTVSFRPYSQYLRGHWTGHHWNVDASQSLTPRLYEGVHAQASPKGADEVYRSLGWLAETHLWDSLRIYGFPLLGLALFSLALRRVPPERQGRGDGLRAWLLLSACAYAFGYLISFCLELDGMKWWLTRFLVAGAAVGMTCLGFAALLGLGRLRPLARRAAWLVLLLVATVGPITELLTAARKRLILEVPQDPIGARLDLIALSKGPFIDDSFEGTAEGAALVMGRWVVGGENRRRGLAIQSRPFPMAPGRYRVGYRIEVLRGTPAMELDVVVDGSKVVAKRRVGAADLETRPGGTWAWLDFELDRPVRDARYRLSNDSDAMFKLTAVRRERLPASQPR